MALDPIYLVLVVSLVQCVQGQSNGDLRLVANSGSTRVSAGRLEIYFFGQWGTVCDDLFGRDEALVACRQLGFASVSSFDRVRDLGFNQPSSSTNIWLDDVICTGSESRLEFCRNDGIGIENCSHSEDVGLICSNIDIVGLVVGVIVGGIVLTIIAVVICIVCCCCCAYKSINRSQNIPTRHTTYQPPPTTQVVYTTTTTPNQQEVTTGYPAQAYPAVPQTAPAPYPPDPYTAPSYPTQAQYQYTSPTDQQGTTGPGYPPDPEPVNPEFYPTAPPPYNDLAAYPPA